jgi:hypothetical protein
MSSRVNIGILALAPIALLAIPLFGQQKGQWVPGQAGLNAGVVPDPGFTYMNLTINYSAGTLNNSSGNAVPGLSGNYSFWATENFFFYEPSQTFFGAHFVPYAIVTFANGSLTASGPLGLPQFAVNGGGEGLADTFVMPFNLAWHMPRADFQLGYGFTAPTGRYTAGASNNVGSGYWGNNANLGITGYLTKNKGTSANLFTDWEIHQRKEGTNETPGQALTIEWGLGQVIPLDKDLHKLFQFGVIGYDQWQVSSNNGTYTLPTGLIVPASNIPYYSVHAIGVQANFIVPKQGLNFFFKYEPEYVATARPIGRTFVFGGSWTLKVPKS